jgi:hypothetical protein
MAKPTHGCLVRWRRITDEAAARGEFTLDERLDAGKWDGCAVGEAYEMFPSVVRYDSDITPVDEELYDLGALFAGCVKYDAFDTARHTLDRIEARLIDLAAQKE